MNNFLYKTADPNLETITSDIRITRSNFKEIKNDPAKIMQYLEQYKPLIDAALDSAIAMPTEKRVELRKITPLYYRGENSEFFQREKDSLNHMIWGHRVSGEIPREYVFEQLERAIAYPLRNGTHIRTDVEVEKLFPSKLHKTMEYKNDNGRYIAELSVTRGTTAENATAIHSLPIDGQRLGVRVLMTHKVLCDGAEKIALPFQSADQFLSVPYASMPEIDSILRARGFKEDK